MKLIGSLTSPYVRKVRVVLAEKKLDYRLQVDNVWSEESEVGASNPLGKVPCLVLEGGDAIYDSRVIVEHLDQLSPLGRLIPPPGRERLEVKTWEALADGLMDAAVLAWLEKNWTGRSDAQRCQAWVDRQLGKVHAGLKEMERLLGDKPFCCGNHLSLADIAVGCALAWLEFRFPNLAWRPGHPQLARLLDKLAQRASFIDTQPPKA